LGIAAGKKTVVRCTVGTSGTAIEHPPHLFRHSVCRVDNFHLRTDNLPH